MTQQQPADYHQLLESDLSRNPSIRRLQYVLDYVLAQEYESILQRRDEVYEKVSQHVQFQKLLQEDLQLSSKEEDEKEQQENEEKEILHDVGSKFYVKAKLLEPRVVHMNVGNNIIVAMTIPEALAHSKRVEESCRARGEKLNKDALASKYKIKLVMEAIMRLQDIQIQNDTQKKK